MVAPVGPVHATVAADAPRTSPDAPMTRLAVNAAKSRSRNTMDSDPGGGRVQT